MVRPDQELHQKIPMIPKVIIQSLPIRNRGYFEWLYTGLQQLHELGKIELKHEGSTWDRFLREHPRVFGKLDQYFPDLCKLLFPVDHFTLFGRVEMGDQQMRFAYDVTDSPFTYALAHLELCDCYFKTQCPITIENAGFPLSSSINVPYHPLVLEKKASILPAMSTGPITSTFNLKRNLRLLRSYQQIVSATKKLKIFASFGGDRGPPSWSMQDLPPAPHNFHNERSIVTRYGNAIQHPNEKRAEIVRILRKWGATDVDGRIWNSRDPEIQGDALQWNDYLRTVSQSVYNINVSGFRRSLPFRFLDSFQVGCGILTDTIGTRWYAPFERGLEVLEYGDAGYEARQSTDWSVIESRLRSIYESIDLAENRSAEIQAQFEKKWHPIRLAEYFLKACCDRL
jgi:hypothetical protein